MFKYKVNLNYSGRRHSYACTRQFYRMNNSHTDKKSDKKAEYWFTQVQSVSSDRRRWTYDTEFFAESFHMSNVSTPRDIKRACTTCLLQDEEIVREVRSQAAHTEELWDYISILPTSEKAHIDRACFVYDINNPVALLKYQRDTKSPKKKGKSIHHKLAIVRKRQPKPAKMDAAAKMYALSRSKFVIQDFIRHGLVMTIESDSFCGINSFRMYQYSKGSIAYAFNHYMDDYKYIRIKNARTDRSVIQFGIYRSKEENNLLHSTPSMSFDESVELAFNMLNTSVTEKLRARDIYINTVLLSTGLRNRHGAICVSGAMATDICRSAKLAGSFQPMCSTSNMYIGLTSINETSSKINDNIITSHTDYCLFFNKFIKKCFHNYIFTEDIARVIIQVDRQRHGGKFDRMDDHNVRVKNLCSVLIRHLLRMSSIIIDYSNSSTFGTYSVCDLPDCKKRGHKHRIIVYIDYHQDDLITNLEFYLRDVRYIANVSDILGDHVRSVSMGDALAILTDESVKPLDMSVLQAETIRIVGVDGMYFSFDEQFGFNEIDYIVLLRQIRARDYEFLQLHNASCFNYSKLLELSKLSREHNECSRKDSVYFFYIGFINIAAPRNGLCNTSALHTINEHMILIGESNVRFKVDVCNKKETTSNLTYKTTKSKVQFVSEVVYGNRVQSFCGTYSECLLKYWTVYMRVHNMHKRTTVSLNELSCRMHSEYSSISAVFSFADRRPMRIYNAKDIKLSHIDEDVDYVYHRAHSFSVTITGAFTKVLDEFGKHYESQRKCSHTCASEKYCHKCVHNVVFCAKDSVVERYISAKFEEFIPYIVSLYEYYSFNGGSTEECDLDRKIFEKHHNMMACGHSVEFLYNKDKRKILKLQRELKQKTISVETLNEILNDSSFCLVHVEPINETYGQIKAAKTASHEDRAALSLSSVIMDHYYRKGVFDSDMPDIAQNSLRSKWLNSCIGRIIKFEEFIEQSLTQLHTVCDNDKKQTKENEHTKDESASTQKDIDSTVIKSHKHKEAYVTLQTDQTHDSMNEYYEAYKDTQTESHTSEDTSQSLEQHEHIPQELSATELEEYMRELEDTVPELKLVYGKTHENYRFAPFENINVEYLGTSKLETNLNRNHSFSCDNIRIQRYSKCHHSFRSPGKLLGSRKRINKPHHIAHRLHKEYSTKAYTMRKSCSLNVLNFF